MTDQTRSLWAMRFSETPENFNYLFNPYKNVTKLWKYNQRFANDLRKRWKKDYFHFSNSDVKLKLKGKRTTFTMMGDYVIEKPFAIQKCTSCTITEPTMGRKRSFLKVNCCCKVTFNLCTQCKLLWWMHAGSPKPR